MTNLQSVARKLVEDAKDSKPTGWKWEGLVQDTSGSEPYIWAPQGSYLGETLITLGDDWDNCGYTLILIQNGPEVMLALADALDEAEARIAALEAQIPKWTTLDKIFEEPVPKRDDS